MFVTLSCQEMPIEDTSEAEKVKTVQFLLSCTRCPGLTTVEQRAENTCLLHVQFRVFCQIVIAPHSPVQFGHDGCSFCYTNANFSI